MEKEFKKRLEEAGDAIEELEDKIEDFTEDFADDMVQLWADVKTNFSGVKEKLKTAVKDLDEKGDEAQLQAHLAAMEARERMQAARESLEEFTHKVSLKSQAELDTVRLRAHLAEMEAEDFWEEKSKSYQMISITPAKKQKSYPMKLPQRSKTTLKSW